MDRERLTSLLGEIDALFAEEQDWTRIYAEVFGINGILREALTAEERAEFQKTEDYALLLSRLAEIRKKRIECEGVKCRVITVRLPPELHSALRAEAHDLHTSMNKLCITKLLMPVDPNHVPTDSKLPVTA